MLGYRGAAKRLILTPHVYASTLPPQILLEHVHGGNGGKGGGFKALGGNGQGGGSCGSGGNGVPFWCTHASVVALSAALLASVGFIATRLKK